MPNRIFINHNFKQTAKISFFFFFLNIKDRTDQLFGYVPENSYMYQKYLILVNNFGQFLINKSIFFPLNFIYLYFLQYISKTSILYSP